LVVQWVAAVFRGGLDRALADHSEEIVMFDGSLPEDIRGVDAYCRAWSPFVRQEECGASSELVSLDVTAGDDVAYAHACVRYCARQEPAAPVSGRLWLTLGLRKRRGNWVVAHVHRSFAKTDGNHAMHRAADTHGDREVREHASNRMTPTNLSFPDRRALVRTLDQIADLPSHDH
jgi:ketosteroid isomerase-like protein